MDSLLYRDEHGVLTDRETGCKFDSVEIDFTRRNNDGNVNVCDQCVLNTHFQGRCWEATCLEPEMRGRVYKLDSKYPPLTNILNTNGH